MANYGPHHSFEDKYGKSIQVDVAPQGGGRSTVDLSTKQSQSSTPAGTRVTVEKISPLSPAKARKLAKQLEEAADHAERYGS